MTSPLTVFLIVVSFALLLYFIGRLFISLLKKSFRLDFGWHRPAKRTLGNPYKCEMYLPLRTRVGSAILAPFFGLFFVSQILKEFNLTTILSLIIWFFLLVLCLYTFWASFRKIEVTRDSLTVKNLFLRPETFPTSELSELRLTTPKYPTFGFMLEYTDGRSLELRGTWCGISDFASTYEDYGDVKLAKLAFEDSYG